MKLAFIFPGDGFVDKGSPVQEDRSVINIGIYPDGFSSMSDDADLITDHEYKNCSPYSQRYPG